MPDFAGTLFARLRTREFSSHPVHNKGPYGYQTTDARLYEEPCGCAKVWNCGVVFEQKGETAREASMGVIGRGAAKWWLEVCRIICIFQLENFALKSNAMSETPVDTAKRMILKESLMPTNSIGSIFCF